jgi:hypothetical protein
MQQFMEVILLAPLISPTAPSTLLLWPASLLMTRLTVTGIEFLMTRFTVTGIEFLHFCPLFHILICSLVSRKRGKGLPRS